MSRNAMNVTRGIITGLVIGGTVGMMAGSMSPKRSRKKKTAGRILDTIGAIIQNAADFSID